MSIPPELLEKYTQQQLADALAAHIVTDVQSFSKVVREIDAMVQDMEKTGDGFTPYPRLSSEFTAEVKAVVDGASEMVAEGTKFLLAIRQMRSKAAAVRIRYEAYAKEINSVLQTIEESPRG